MHEHQWLAERFEAHRYHLRAVAYRLLGSPNEADDAVQQSWLHVSRAGASDVENLRGWMTTIVARVCLDMLRSRKSRPEDPALEHLADLPASEDTGDPEQQAVLTDSVGLALLVVLETLSPAERLAFVLHDVFAVSFDEIAPIVERTPAAARKLASRARRRVQGASPPASDDRQRQREVVGAFLAASRGGDFAALLALLDPEVVLRADATAVLAGASKEVRGAAAVAETFSGRARAARSALIDGAPGAVWLSGGKPRVVFSFTIANGTIVAINLLADPVHLSQINVTVADKG